MYRYLLRPPFALDAVARTADGQVRVHFEKSNRFGATFAQMTLDTFLARLCALVPPPRAHTVLYHDVLAAHRAPRSAVVPCCDQPEARARAALLTRAASWRASPPSPPFSTLSSVMLHLLGCRG